MSPRFVLGRENVPCVAEVVNRSLKADCTDFTIKEKQKLVKEVGLSVSKKLQKFHAIQSQ